MRRNNEMSAFSWYGGKTYHLNWLLPIIDSIPHKSYVESFGGSAAVLLNKESSEIEIYNDAYGEVVNFFKVLRNQGPELIELLKLTPYSREEFAECCHGNLEASAIEKARMFFVKARQVRSGLATKATPGRWSYTKKDSRRGVPLPISQWLGAVNGLQEISNRLKIAQIENLDALDIIQRYDTENTLHYIDPPYLMATRTGGVNYSHEYSESDHLKLIEVLINLKGKVILSGYINDMYTKKLLGWKECRRQSCLANTTLQDGEKQLRQEVVWFNFNYQPIGEGWE